MCCASSPSATFSNTVSHGKSAKLWNTIEMPSARTVDRLAADSVSVPALGCDKPAISRSSVDLPEPERPSSPTICPGDQRQVHAIEHQQVAAIGLGK